MKYEENLAHFYSPNTATLVTNILLAAPNVLKTEPFFRWNLIFQDPDANKFADVAISAGANYLVSNDRHFNILKNVNFPPIAVVTLGEFRQILSY